MPIFWHLNKIKIVHPPPPMWHKNKWRHLYKEKQLAKWFYHIKHGAGEFVSVFQAVIVLVSILWFVSPSCSTSLNHQPASGPSIASLTATQQPVIIAETHTHTHTTRQNKNTKQVLEAFLKCTPLATFPLQLCVGDITKNRFPKQRNERAC